MKLLKIFLVFLFFLNFSIYSENIFKVVKVIDGDTILLENGEKVRYIGIDTPETKHPKKEVEYFGEEAYKINKKLVEGKKVKLEFDVQKRDRYGRLLAYVFVGEIFVNAYLLKNGYALVYTVPPNVKYQEKFLKLEKFARENKLGLWKEDIKENKPENEIYVASKFRKPFHYIWCKWAKKISPANKVFFYSREEAIKAGHRPCKICNP